MYSFTDTLTEQLKKSVQAVGLCGLLVSSVFYSAAANATILKDEKNLGWVSKQDLTSSQFFSEFTKYKKKGYMMIDVDAYRVNGSLRYSMIWRKNTDGRAWAEHRNLTSSQYSEKWNDYKNRGYRPLDIAAYQGGSSTLFAGIWVKNKEKIAWASYRNLTGTRYGEIFADRRNAGYRLVDMEAYETSAGLRYSAIWYKNVDNIPWLQLRNMTRSTYQEQVNLKSDQGYTVVDYEAYPTSNGTRYAAIWEKKPGYATQVRTNRSKTAYINLWNQYRDEGYRLVDFERNGDKYSGIWVENASRYRYSKKSQLNQLIRNYQKDNNVPGLSVAVIENGTTRYRRGFGFADINDNKKAHSETVYLAASVSKIIGSTLAAKLEDEFRLRDDTPIYLDLGDTTRSYLSGMPRHHRHTVEELLSHLGCVAHYSTSPGIANQTTHYSNAQDAAMSIWNTGLVSGCTIGNTGSYSTHAFTFVAAVMEEATGRSINDLLISELFKPYALNSMRVQYASNSLPINYDRATPYSGTSNNETSYSDNSWKVLGGGIETNAYDLARFGWKILNGEIVDGAARDNRMWTRISPSSNGLGWSVRSRNGRRVAEHNGAWTGARSNLRVYRDDGLVIAVLSNSRDKHSSGDVSTLTEDIANIVLN